MVTLAILPLKKGGTMGRLERKGRLTRSSFLINESLQPYKKEESQINWFYCFCCVVPLLKNTNKDPTLPFLD